MIYLSCVYHVSYYVYYIIIYFLFFVDISSVSFILSFIILISLGPAGHDSWDVRFYFGIIICLYIVLLSCILFDPYHILIPRIYVCICTNTGVCEKNIPPENNILWKIGLQKCQIRG